jgi:protein-glutamine gamma-glutamyltransferase
MKIEKIHSTKKVTAQLLLLILPAVVIGGYMLWHINHYYTVLNNQWVKHTLFLSAGLITGCIFYSHRFRFLPTFLGLLLALFIIGKIIGNVFTGEFSAFYANTNFFIFSFLFTVGWLIGWGFARLRYFPIILSVVLLVIQMIVVSKTTDITAQKLMIAFAPVLLFALYIVYAAELVRNMNEDEPSFSWFIGKRLVGFGVITSIILLCLLLFFNQEFKAIEKEFGGAAKEEQNEGNRQSMTKKNKDGTVSNNDQMGMGSSRRKSKQLVFIAKLDNYFEDSITPNPLYFTYDYYTKFDTMTQTFEIDSTMPSNDLFKPDPSKIALYFTKTDSSVLTRAKGHIKRKVVTAEVYKSLLSPNDFLAPSTAFFCQPIAVEKDYKQQFKSAYRAKMYVSELNSAYFVYNPAGNQQLETFQQQRFNELRTVTGWPGEDKAFMDYYTFMPRGGAYDTISMLAKQLTANAPTPIDKMIAIRDYFLSLDENKQPLFKYTDNPGIPGLPSANKLTYFLLENRKGYCAYFAGATLFLFRSLGIPSRIATGFLTVDRSDKNKGWYWFYEDQAHAWVQVYFPGYGWIDFDTTIPSTEQQEAPAPDGTPPVNMQSAFLVAHGKILSVDTVRKKAEMEVQKVIYHDKVFDVPEPYKMTMDLSIATITRDSGAVALSELKKGNEVTALSFSEQFKSIPPAETDKIGDVVNKVPVPAPIDEIRILDPEKEKAKKKAASKKEEPTSIWTIVWTVLAVLGGLVLLVFSTPALIYAYMRSRANGASVAKKTAYWSFTAASYLLNQLGYKRESLTPLQFAQQKVDNTFGTELAAFTQVYLKTKYSSMPLLPYEEKTIQVFYPAFEKTIKSKIPFKQRFSKFLNFYRTIGFFTKPKN